MKEKIMDLLTIIIISFIALIAASFLTTMIGRAVVYSHTTNSVNNDKNMQICLSKNIDFKDCYQAIYNYNAFKN